MALPNPSSAAAGAPRSTAAPSPLVASLRGVSAHGLVSLERAEGTIQRLIDTVNEQALQISSLFLLVQTLVTSGAGDTGAEMRLPSSLLTVEGRLASLEARLGSVEKAIQVPGVDPSVTIGDVVSTNGVELSAALDALGKKASAQESSARHEKLEKAVTAVYEWAGPRELVDRLEESARATRQQVAGMEAALACKVDRADAAGLEATLARVKAFAARVDALEAAHNEGMRSATGAIKVVDDKAQAALGQLQAAHKAIDALEEKQAAWRRETLELLKEVEGELAATASLTQLDGKLDARAWDREWRVACERLDGKADAEEARALRGRLAGVEEELVRLGRESDLYSRFVQWFYAHGQAHEHNLQTIDRTLGRLAKESLEREQQRLAHRRRQQEQQRRMRRQQQQQQQQHPSQHDSSLLTATDEEAEEEGGGVGGAGARGEGDSDLNFSSSSSSSSAAASPMSASSPSPGVVARGARAAAGGAAGVAWRGVLGGGLQGSPLVEEGEEEVGEEGEETVTLSP